jgi:hypothetical protein
MSQYWSSRLLHSRIPESRALPVVIAGSLRVVRSPVVIAGSLRVVRSPVVIAGSLRVVRSPVVIAGSLRVVRSPVVITMGTRETLILLCIINQYNN